VDQPPLRQAHRVVELAINKAAGAELQPRVAMVWRGRRMSTAIRIAAVGLFGRLVFSGTLRTLILEGAEDGQGRGKTDATQGIRQMGYGSP